MLLLVAVLGLVHWRLLLGGGPVAVLAIAAFTGLLLVVVLAALSWSSSVRAVPLVSLAYDPGAVSPRDGSNTRRAARVPHP